MKNKMLAVIPALWAMCCVSTSAQAAVLDQARAVAATSTLQSLLPESQAFTISAAGTYTLTLTDQGEIAQSGAAAFSSLYVVITRGAQKIAMLTMPGNASTISANITLVAGSYQAQVMGITSGASSYVVELKNAANAVVWNDAGDINATVAPDFSTLEQVVSLVPGHSYTLSLTDHVFPAALDSLIANVTQAGGVPGCNVVAGSTCSFTATTAEAAVFALADPDTGGKGLYGVKLVDNTNSAVVLGASYPVGELPDALNIPLPATDAYTLTTTDLAVPVALTAFKSVLVQGAVHLGNQSTTGTMAFTASNGVAQLYVQATAGSGEVGLFGVNVVRGSTQIYSDVQPVENAVVNGEAGYVFDAQITTPGTYTVKLTDFVAPQSLASVSMAVSQNGQLLGQQASSGELTINNVSVGTLSVAVLPVAGGTSGSGLFGVTVTPSGGAAVLEVTQGIGGAFDSSSVTIAQAGSYGLRITDLLAPASFDNLIITLTRGAQQFGTVHGVGGSGEFPFIATPGVYTLNVVAKAKSSAGFAMHGIRVAAAPVISLQASSSSVGSGSPVTLTWNATDADSCSASGGWSGSKAVSGSETIASIAAQTTFTLSCTGVARTSTQSVTVKLTAAQASSKSGGGMMGMYWILMFAGMTLLRRRVS